jgi:hypothetical protein
MENLMDSSKTELNNDHGFVKKKYVTKKLVPGPDGRPQLVFVDTTSNQVVQNPKGYTVIESSNVVDPAQQSQSQGFKPQQAEDPKSQMTNEVRGIPETHDSANIAAAKQTGQKSPQGEDYGYTNKPPGAGLLGFLPQPFGLIATAGNLGINAKNNQAINEQRDVLGFSENPMGKQVGNTVLGNDGYIGDQSVVDGMGKTRTTPVGFESTDPAGRTTLTPNEARMRETLNPEQYSEASQASIDNARTKFAAENPSWGTSLANAAKSAFGNMFGSSPASMEGKPGAGSGNSNGFPDAPSKPTNTISGIDSGKGPGVDTSGYSPGLW